MRSIRDGPIRFNNKTGIDNKAKNVGIEKNEYLYCFLIKYRVNRYTGKKK
jgi:hypothetical protein